MRQIFNTISFRADYSGCGFYRMQFPSMALQTISRDIQVIDSPKLIGDPKFFHDVRMVRLQRQVNDAQANYFLKFLKPLSQALGFWLCYEIDDVIRYEDIPPYNMGRRAFENKMFFNNVQNMLNAADFITVTSEELKKYYIKHYEVKEDKFLVIPNYLPRWWVGETYSLSRQKNQFQQYINKPRIGFPASTSHFDVQNVNNGVDDFTHIIDFIKSTTNKYQWVFIGGCPRQLEGLARSRKIEIVPGSDLLNYPRELWRRNLQCIVAPLQDNAFNRAKSCIKLVEAWGLGIPCIVQDLPCYNKYTDMVFKDSNQLQNQLDRLFQDKNRYSKVIKEGRKIVDYGDNNAPNGWWIEKNLQPWYDLYSLAQKTLKFDLTKNPKQQANKIVGKEEGIKLDLSK